MFLCVYVTIRLHPCNSKQELLHAKHTHTHIYTNLPTQQEVVKECNAKRDF